MSQKWDANDLKEKRDHFLFEPLQSWRLPQSHLRCRRLSNSLTEASSWATLDLGKNVVVEDFCEKFGYSQGIVLVQQRHHVMSVQGKN